MTKRLLGLFLPLLFAGNVCLAVNEDLDLGKGIVRAAAGRFNLFRHAGGEAIDEPQFGRRGWVLKGYLREVAQGDDPNVEFKIESRDRGGSLEQTSSLIQFPFAQNFDASYDFDLILAGRPLSARMQWQHKVNPRFLLTVAVYLVPPPEVTDPEKEAWLRQETERYAGVLHEEADKALLYDFFLPDDVEVAIELPDNYSGEPFPLPQPGDTFEVWIQVRIDFFGSFLTGAEVTGSVTPPDGPTQSLAFTEDQDFGGVYNAFYSLNENSPIGSYQVIALASKSPVNESGRVDFAVGEESTLPMQVEVSTDKSNYALPGPGATAEVLVAVILASDNEPVEGAELAGEIDRPDGKTDTLEAIDFSDAGGGNYSASYQLEESSPKGVYEVTVNARSDALEGSGSAVFTLGAPANIIGSVISGTSDHYGKPQPLVHVPVVLVWDGQQLPEVLTDDSGEFAIQDPSLILGGDQEGYLIIRLAERGHAELAHEGFEIYNQASTNPTKVVTVFTKSFKLDPSSDLVDEIKTDQVILNDIDFSKPGLFDEPSDAAEKSLLRDDATIYFHIHQAYEFTRVKLDLKLDLGLPLPIWTHVPENDSAFWRGPTLASPSTDVLISIGESDSAWNDPNRPMNREWHEFGHHVMADAFGNQMPKWHERKDGKIYFEENHGGYGNPSTTDSWTEAWAEFFSCLVAADLGWADWRVYQPFHSLEQNIKTWAVKSYEEFAVAGILVDLRDPKLGADKIQLTTEEIWKTILNADSSNILGLLGTNHIFDVKDLYDAFSNPLVQSQLGYTQEDLDENFIVHGAFNDEDDDAKYDEGEEVGRVAYPQRPSRRNHPLEEGSFIRFSARDSQTGGAVEVNGFTIRVSHDPPKDIYDYQFRTVAKAPDLLYLQFADVEYPARAYVRAHAENYHSSDEFLVGSEFYFQQMEVPDTVSLGHFTEHTFILGPALSSDFGVEGAPFQKVVVAGETANFDVFTTSLQGFDSDLELTVTGLPAGTNALFSENTIKVGTGTQLAVSTTASAVLGSHPLAIEARGGGQFRSDTIRLKIVKLADYGANTYTLLVSKAGSGSGYVSSTPSGIDCGEDCSEAYEPNTEVRLEAVPQSGSIFAGWSGSCTGTGTCTVNMDQAHSVTATFTSAGSACIYSISPDSRQHGAASEMGIVTVTASPGCEWTAASNVAWLTITSGASGSGSGTVSYSVASGSGCRSGALTIQGQDFIQTFTVIQSGGASGSDTWTRLVLGEPTDEFDRLSFGILAIAVNPQNSDVIYAGSNDGRVFKTTDGGANWGALAVGMESHEFVTVIAIDPQNPANVYVGADNSNNGLYKSADAGSSWSIANGGSFSRVWALALDPSNPSTIYAGNNGEGVSKTTDAGANWSPANNGLAFAASSLAMDPTNASTLYAASGEVFKTTDGGALWTPVLVIDALPPVATVVAIEPQNPSTVYAGGVRGKLYKSADAGANWTDISPALNSERDIRSIVVDPESAVYVLADDIDVAKSADGGVSWEEVGAGGDQLPGQGATLALDPNDSSRVFAGTFRNGIYVTGSSGSTQCAFSISPTSRSHDSGQSLGSVNVTATAGSAWTASSNAAWLDVTSGAVGSGNGSVDYSVAANELPSQRSGTLTIAGETFTVDQAAGTAPVLRFTLSVQRAGAGSGLVTSNPAGINCAPGIFSDCREIYDQGTIVTLSATPGFNSVFDSWSGDCAGNGGCTVTMDRDRSVTATFRVQDAPAQPELNIVQVDSGACPSIEVSVSVADREGQPVEGLSAADFQLREDGILQTISVAAAEMSDPVSVALLVDGSSSLSEDELERAKESARILVSWLPSFTAVAIYSFADTVDLLADFTTDRFAKQQVLDSIASQGMSSLYDAIDEASRLLAPRDGQKAIVILGDFEDTASVATLAQAIDIAEGAAVEIFSLAAESDTNFSRQPETTFSPKPSDRGRKSSPLGLSGLPFEVLRAIAPMAAGDYRLAYTTSNAEQNHSLEVTVTVDGQSASDTGSVGPCAVVGQGGVHLDVLEVNGQPGKAVDVPVTMATSGGAQPIGFQFDLTYDPARLTLNDKPATREGEQLETAGKELSVNQISENQVRLIAAGFNQNVIEDGTVAYLNFTLAAGFPEDEATTLGCSEAKSGGAQSEQYPTTTSNGSITAFGCSCDINGDGVVDLFDILKITDQALGREPPECDLNNDGAIDIFDLFIVIDAALGKGCNMQ